MRGRWSLRIVTLTPTLSHQGRGGLRPAQDERGTGFYLDKQDERDGQDFLVWGVASGTIAHETADAATWQAT